jgi:glutamate-ammonia-ligase adenylyltransferase
LREGVERALETLASQPDGATVLQGLAADVRESLPRVFGASEFVANACARNPALLAELAPRLKRPTTAAALHAQAARLAQESSDENAFMAGLRRFRQREMVRVAWRDLAGHARCEGTLSDLSHIADAAVAAAHAFALRGLVERYGEPVGEAGEPQELLVLGMGKLGGGELNFSSDIDLVYLFPAAGETRGRRPVSNEEFFTRLGRAVIRLLDAITPEGFVFRVDLRLRPFGDSGPLVASFAFFESYLQQHGRDWERYAYVKARAITGAARYESLYSEVVRPFVYRRYLDFGVFESLRNMKELIARDVARRELKDNVKLGPGGIREIEFVVQAFQLLRGGTDRRLQSQSLLTVLPLLAGHKLLPAETVAGLRAAYMYLRSLENRLQMTRDEQTHELPHDVQGRERLALAMNVPGWDAMLAELDRHRQAVTRIFQSILFGPASAQATTPGFDLESIWDSSQRLPALRESIDRIGIAEADALAASLAEWLGSTNVQRLEETGRRRLQALVPRILEAMRGARDRPTVLRRIVTILDAVGGRSAYFALLNENAVALTRLVDICERSEFLARQIASFPLLLDELIDARILESAPTRAQFVEELASRREHAPESDPERQVESLRQFQRVATFRVALADLTGRLPLMHVSDRLTDIAELILEEAMRMAWNQLVTMHGQPMCGDPSAPRPASVAAVAYGKLGAMELGYGSDLDLVFLHDSGGEYQRTNGPRPVDNAVFFLRLGQRIVHLLTVHSAAGRLYEVDMRLRPSGKGGLMVTQLEAFENYQAREAWTWEHQALLRARAVAGAPALRSEFERIRMDVLRSHVRRDSLREDVRKMRERMRSELSKAGAGQFDVKQDPGGLADIEFLAQYWALWWAEKYPPVAMFPDTIRQLESVASANLVPQETVDALTRIYRDYRREIHYRSLEDAPAVVEEGRFAGERAQVIGTWEKTMGPS